MTDNTLQELLPCPFCGESVQQVLNVHDSGGEGNRYMHTSKIEHFCPGGEFGRPRIGALELFCGKERNDNLLQDCAKAQARAWNTRAQPSRQKVGAGDGDTYIGGATVYRKPQPAPAAGDAFSDVLLEQHQGDCIQRINIPNARLVAALPTPSISEDEAVEIMKTEDVRKKIKLHQQGLGGINDIMLEAYRALLAAGVIRGNV